MKITVEVRGRAYEEEIDSGCFVIYVANVGGDVLRLEQKQRKNQNTAVNTSCI